MDMIDGVGQLERVDNPLGGQIEDVDAAVGTRSDQFPTCVASRK